jgi:alkane 1-monooxygenase
LVHKKEDRHKFVGSIPFFLCSYSHFGPEHTKGHHKHIATIEDPVSADKGWSYYYHTFRSVCMTHKSSWDREIERISKTGGHPILNNQMTTFFLLHAAKYMFVGLVFGKGGLYFQAIYTTLGFFWVEAANYIEHYGLRRAKDADGTYEAVNSFHSWNAPASCVLFNLQRHSDHHCISYRPYQILRHFKDVPFLPYEYFVSIVIALFPPLWFYVMDPKVEAVRRAMRGEKVVGQEDQWCNKMPMSKGDKWRARVVSIFLGLLTAGMTYMTWRNGCIDSKEPENKFWI